MGPIASPYLNTAGLAERHLNSIPNPAVEANPAKILPEYQLSSIIINEETRPRGSDVTGLKLEVARLPSGKMKAKKEKMRNQAISEETFGLF